MPIDICISLSLSISPYLYSVVSSITNTTQGISRHSGIMSSRRQLWYGRIHRDKAAQGYAHLRCITDARDGKKSDSPPRPILTKNDTQFEATKHLYLTATRLNNAAKVSEDYCGVFSDKSSSRTKIIQKSRHLSEMPRIYPSWITIGLLAAGQQYAVMPR